MPSSSFTWRIATSPASSMAFMRCVPGLPLNIASYALLVHMMAQQCNLEVGDFVWTGGESRLYSDHM
ncbi:thymidylate synthase [Shigella flexneri]